MPMHLMSSGVPAQKTLTSQSSLLVYLNFLALIIICLKTEDRSSLGNFVHSLLLSISKLMQCFLYSLKICRQLCVLLDAEDIYRTLATILTAEENLSFASTMVDTLNTILLTATELFELRNKLKDLATEVRFFNYLFHALCYGTSVWKIDHNYYSNFLSGELYIVLPIVSILVPQPSGYCIPLLAHSELCSCKSLD